MAKQKIDRTKTWRVGDTVSWSSQAAGSWRTKTGEVVEIAEPGRRFQHSPALALGSSQRRYRVKVVTKHTRGEKVTYYFPTTTALQRGPVDLP